MAERHVREGERRVANQRGLVVHLREHGHRTGMAESLLSTFEDLLEMSRQHVIRIRDGSQVAIQADRKP